MRWYGFGLLVWLLIGVALCGVWAIAVVNASRDLFEQEARILHRELSQRAEQHEAVLAGLNALERSRVGVATQSEFALALQKRYPQIEAIARCSTQPAASCVSLRGDLSSFDASVLERPGMAVTSLPDRDGTAQFAFWQRSMKSVFVLRVNVTRLVEPAAFPNLEASLELNPRSGSVRVLRGVSLARETMANPWLPRFEVTKTLGSATQPFVLHASSAMRADALPFARMLAMLFGGALLSLLLTRVLILSFEARLERARAEVALGQERARAEGTLRAVSDALFTCDRDGFVTLANPAAQTLVGLGRAALIGQPLSAVVRLQGSLSGSSLGRFLEGFWEQPQVMELPPGSTILDAFGQARLIEGSIAPLWDEAGRPVGAVLACRDLGPFRKRMLEALEESERRVREHESTLAHVGRVSTLSEIAAGIAHELNQPLTAILSQAQASLRLLEDGEANLPQFRRSLQASAEQAKRASHILERLRAHVARQPLNHERVDLRQLVENVRVLTEHELRERSIRLEAAFAVNTLEVEGDAIQLEQVLHNLVRNAIEALATLPPERRAIRISGGQCGGSVQLEVRDFGMGIGASVLPQLFTPFVSSKPGGLGLGLSLSQTLMQGMGGSLSAENAADGGARFTLTMKALGAEPVSGVAHVGR
jgi:two-component system, LuxR family, sensor kinase FixL